MKSNIQSSLLGSRAIRSNCVAAIANLAICSAFFVMSTAEILSHMRERKSCSANPVRRNMSARWTNDVALVLLCLDGGLVLGGTEQMNLGPGAAPERGNCSLQEDQITTQGKLISVECRYRSRKTESGPAQRETLYISCAPVTSLTSRAHGVAAGVAMPYRDCPSERGLNDDSDKHWA